MRDGGRIVGFVLVGIVVMVAMIALLGSCSDETSHCRICGQQGTNFVGYCNPCWEALEQ